MKKLVFILVLAMIGGAMQAQSSTLSKKEQKQLLKEEKRRVAEEEAARQFQLVEYMMKGARFVLEADMISDRNGQSTSVQSMLNFILVDSLHGVIQVGNNFGIGQNGVGGTTVEGDIVDYELKKDEKRKAFTVQYSLKSIYGTYRVVLTTQANGRADARVSGTFSGGSLRYSGRLVHPTESRVYKGSSF